MNEMRGLFALEVILGHVFRWENCFLTPLGKFMICSVAFFFFVSGFTMTESALNKEGYLDWRFLKNKIGYLLLISLVVYYVNRFIDFLSPYDLGYSAKSLFSLYDFFWRTNWFIWELMAFYIVFFFTYKYVPSKYRIITLFVITLVGCTLLHMSGLFYNWVASAFGFLLGCLFIEHYEECSQILCSVKGIFITQGFAVAGIFSIIIKEENYLTSVVLRNCICVAAILIILFMCEWEILRDNPISKF